MCAGQADRISDVLTKNGIIVHRNRRDVVDHRAGNRNDQFVKLRNREVSDVSDSGENATDAKRRE